MSPRKSLLVSVEHEVVAVHGLVARAREDLAHGVGLQPEHAAAARRRSSCRCPSRACVRGRWSSSGSSAISTASPASNSPIDLDDADGQQAGAALAHGAHGAGVDHERAARGLGVLQPQLEARVARLAGGEARALALAGEHRGERLARARRCRSRWGCRRRWPSRRRRPSSASRRSRAARSCGRSRARRARRSR